MGEGHDLLIHKGWDAAGEAFSPIERQLATKYLSDINHSVDYAPGYWCHAIFPYRTRIPAHEVWNTSCEHSDLQVSPGVKQVSPGVRTEDISHSPAKADYWGVPRASWARIALISLHTLARLNPESRYVDLGTNSLRESARQWSRTTGGKTFDALSEQWNQLFHCTISLRSRDGREAVPTNQKIAEKVFYGVEDTLRRVPTALTISQQYHKLMFHNDIAIDHAAVRVLANDAPALDVYVMLARDLPALEEPLFRDWNTVCRNYGPRWPAINCAKPAFLRNLAKALAVYPCARIDVKRDGIELHPSPRPTECPLPDQTVVDRLTKLPAMNLTNAIRQTASKTQSRRNDDKYCRV